MTSKKRMDTKNRRVLYETKEVVYLGVERIKGRTTMVEGGGTVGGRTSKLRVTYTNIDGLLLNVLEKRD